MNERKTFKLIEGVFSAHDAQFIILNFYNEKIMFHNRELLAMKIRNDPRTDMVEAKISSLENSRKELVEYLKSFPDRTSLFDIKGSIKIRLINT